LSSTAPITPSSSPKLLVIVATYNEIDSLPRLVIQIDQRLPEADILVIDDASPDGTGNWCEEVVDKYPQLSVIHRAGKLGLGSAAIEGFQWAAGRDYDLVATMDADLSHAPQSLLEMHDKMRSVEFEQVGVMIGSRYAANPPNRFENRQCIRKILAATKNQRQQRSLPDLPTRSLG